MKLNKVINIITFRRIREDRNTAEQLKKENDYSLSENNQKKISKAIDNLGPINIFVAMQYFTIVKCRYKLK